MHPYGQISQPLLLATAVIVIAGMVAFRCSDWGRDTAMRMFVGPMEYAMRLAWR